MSSMFEHLVAGSVTGVDRLAPTLGVVDGKRERLDALRPLPLEFLASIEQWYEVELTYSSNALEGNTLTRSETLLVLEKGVTVGGKSLTEHLEATNHRDALRFVRAIAEPDALSPTEGAMLELHRLILKGIDDEHAGRYRDHQVFITGAVVDPPAAFDVPAHMAAFVAWLAETADPGVTHPVARAAEAHYRLARIHPFVDGNGRAARLLMNLLLIQYGYPPAVIEPVDRLAYIDALAATDERGLIDDFSALIAKAVERSLDRYLLADPQTSLSTKS